MGFPEWHINVQRDLWLINKVYQKVVEPGAFGLMVGGASDMIQLTAELTVAQDMIASDMELELAQSASFV